MLTTLGDSHWSRTTWKRCLLDSTSHRHQSLWKGWEPWTALIWQCWKPLQQSHQCLLHRHQQLHLLNPPRTMIVTFTAYVVFLSVFVSRMERAMWKLRMGNLGFSSCLLNKSRTSNLWLVLLPWMHLKGNDNTVPWEGLLQKVVNQLYWQSSSFPMMEKGTAYVCFTSHLVVCEIIPSTTNTFPSPIIGGQCWSNGCSTMAKLIRSTLKRSSYDGLNSFAPTNMWQYLGCNWITQSTSLHISINR